jgi:hypothetical protein
MRESIKLAHENGYAAEVPVELIEDDTAWSSYLSPDNVRKLDAVRLAYGAVFQAGAGEARRSTRKKRVEAAE